MYNYFLLNLSNKLTLIKTKMLVLHVVVSGRFIYWAACRMSQYGLPVPHPKPPLSDFAFWK